VHIDVLYSLASKRETEVSSEQFMMSPPRPAIAVFARSRCRAEALSLSISVRTEHTAFPLNPPELVSLECCSTLLIDVDTNIEPALELVREVVTVHPGTTVVVLGLSESEESIVKLAEAGASGYVSARSSFDEMISVILSARHGEFSCSPDTTYSLFRHLAALAREEEIDHFTTATLTTRERQVIGLLTRDLTNKEIGRTLCVSEFTVKNHVHHLLKKLRIRNRRMIAQRCA
jgi:two-component system nitrate/nitrite response regulator NarL